MMIALPIQLSDEQLLEDVKRLAGSEREATAQLIAHLGELDVRRLYLGAGYSSLFTYCCEVLRLSEHGTYNRIEAARAARRFPAILDMLNDGRLNLTSVRLLAPHLTNENHAELLPEAVHKSKRGVEELVACRFPRPDVASSIRKVLVAKTEPATGGTAVTSAATVACSASPTPSMNPGASAPVNEAIHPAVSRPPRRAVVAPLAADRYEICFTAGGPTLAKLRQAQDLLRHAIPDGDLAEIFDRALSLLVEEQARKKVAATNRPGKGRGRASHSRTIPAKVRRAVWLRDSGRCGFASKGGRRCQERGFLEFHHVKPYAAGGHPTADNIELRCRAHNLFEADVFFGPIRVAMSDERSTRSGASSPAPPPTARPG